MSWKRGVNVAQKPRGTLNLNQCQMKKARPKKNEIQESERLVVIVAQMSS